MRLKFILDRQHRMSETEARLRQAMIHWRNTYDSTPSGPLCAVWDAGTRVKKTGKCPHDSCWKIATGGLL